MRRRSGREETIAWPGLVDFFSLGMVIMLVLFVTVFMSLPRDKPEDRLQRLQKENEELREANSELQERVSVLEEKAREAERWVTRVREELGRIRDRLRAEGADVPFRAEDLRVPAEGSPRLEIGTFGGRQVKFGTLQYSLDGSDEETLRRAARVITKVLGSDRWKQARYFVEIRGEADPRRLDREVLPRNNRELSALRAAEVARVLLDGGLGEDRLRIVGLGVSADPDEARPRPGETPHDVERRLEKYRTVRINIVPEVRLPGADGHPRR